MSISNQKLLKPRNLLSFLKNLFVNSIDILPGINVHCYELNLPYSLQPTRHWDTVSSSKCG